MPKKYTRFLSFLCSFVAISAISLTSISHLRAESFVVIDDPSLGMVLDSLESISTRLSATIRLLDETNQRLYGSVPYQYQYQSPDYNTLTAYIDFVNSIYSTGTAPVHPATLLGLRVLEQQLTLQQLSVSLINRIELLECLPVLIPCEGTITSLFGVRMHPISHRRKMHDGLDISAPSGTPILASGKGIVTYAGWQRGYGRVVRIDHGFGYETLYAHASSLKVAKGDDVNRGDTIALVGSSGRSTGAHLHYEVFIDSANVDPSGFLIHTPNDIISIGTLYPTLATTN